MRNTPANENSELSFISLQAATRNVIQYLQGDKEQREESERETERADREKQREEDQRKYIEQRLREAVIWERRISGK